MQKKIDNNIVELSTISNYDVEGVNINKLKGYCHNCIPIYVVMIILIINTKPSNKSRKRHGKGGRSPNQLPWLKSKPKNLPWTNFKSRNEITIYNIKWIQNEDLRIDI